MKKEELLDKYIKYNSKITFDIFNLMYQKLFDLGFISPHNVERAFRQFSGEYPFFIIQMYCGQKYFNQHIYQESKSEISVEDLLGYNPFENFILPEKWYVKVTGDSINYPELAKWRGPWCYSGISYVKSDTYWTAKFPEDFIEITLEQFKQYVLKEPVKIETSKTEKDWSKVSNEELLEEAKRRYPVGCIFKCLVTENDYVMKEDVEFKYEAKGIYSYIDNSLYHKHYENNEWAEVVSLPESKVEEVVPEYVECSYSNSAAFIINKIYKCEPLSKANALNLNSEKGLIKTLPYKGSVWGFKPSTKEAFEAQNKPKSIQKWSVGSYAVALEDKINWCNTQKGDIYEITNIGIATNLSKSYDGLSFSTPKSDTQFKWFATKSEAEEFAKTLISTIKEEGKQSLKQAVHCQTQEEWDFVNLKMKFTAKFGISSCVRYLDDGCISSIEYFKKRHLDDYQLLSFQEWCDLNGYKMTKTRFKKGDYVVSLRPERLSTHSIKYNYCYIQYTDGDRISVDTGATMYDDDHNYARLATAEEIEEYKRIGKPYDVSTLQSKSMNTYGLNVGDKLDAIIIAAWEKKDSNYYSDSSEGWIFGNGAAYDKNRKIENFKVINGVVGFLVSGTLGIYLRAEGFKEFADNYNKSKEPEVKFEIGKWYKVCDGEGELGNGLWYVKSPKIVDGIIKVDQYLYNDCFGEGGNFGPAGYYTFVEVPLSEIQHLLPENHPDKLVKSNGIPMGIKIEANSFYGSTLVQRSQFNKEEIYLLPDPD